TLGPILVHWGIDLWAPSAKLVENAHLLSQDARFSRFTLATPQEFFDALGPAPRTDVLSGEVPLAWPHVVDGILHLWQLAVPATTTLKTAETFATINYALGYADYPQAEFEGLWKRLIESMDHNHDGQGGEIGDRRKQEYSEAAIIDGGEILRRMLRNIAERVRIPVAKSFPIVVFNGLGWQRDDVVRAHVTLFGDVIPSSIADYKKTLRLVDETGKSVPFHVAYTSENISRAIEVWFVAQGVPALGYKTYLLTAEPAESLPPTSTVELDRDKDQQDPRRPLGADVIENTFYRVTIDKATGRVTVFDKQLGREACKDLEIAAREERGTNNVQRELETGRTIPRVVTETSLEENNPVRTVFRVSGWIADIPVVQRLILYQGVKRLDIENSLDWKEQRLVSIEQLFPLEQPNAAFSYGVPFGANDRHNLLPGSGPRAEDEIQKSMWEQYRTIQHWVFAGTPEWGITLAADHQLVRLEDGLIRGSMIRGQRYTSVKIVRGDETTSIHFPAPGHYVFRFSFSSGPGDWRVGHAYRAGLAFNNPLIPVSVLDEISTKALPPTHSFVRVAGDNLVISALKKAEQSGSLILRLYDIAGTSAETSVIFNNAKQTFRETDLLEEDVAGSHEQQVLHVGPYEIKTVRLGSSGPPSRP
ncbi:MAG TPA: glycosyl hydrolase-related protein, partial [Gemmatimonadales bacterium]|nr:glycosyl hydrolase-related protein [Gemmatimonadales bacterium]